MRFGRLFLVVWFMALGGAHAFARPFDSTPQAYATIGTESLPDRLRVTFTWNLQQNIPFTVNRHEDEVWLHFEKPVTMGWNKLTHTPDSVIQDVEALNNNTTFILTLRRPEQVATFLKYNENGIDLLQPQPRKRPRAKVAQIAPPEIPAPAAVHKKPASKSVNNAHPNNNAEPEKITHNAPRRPENEKKLSSVETPPAAIALAPAPASSPSFPVASALLAPASPQKPPLVASSADSPSATGIPTEPPPASGGIQGGRVVPYLQASLPNPPAGGRGFTQAVPPEVDLAQLSPSAGTAAIANPDRETFELNIAPDEPFAAFLQQRTLWLVAKPQTRLTLNDLKKLTSNTISSVQKISNNHASIFQLTLNSDEAVSFEKASADKTRMILQPTPMPLKQNLLPELHTNSARLASLQIPSAKAEEVVTVRDPANDQELNIILLPDPGVGITPIRNFTGFTLLPTAQGVVMQRTADDVTIAAHQGIIEVSSPKGLTVSADTVKSLTQSAIDAVAETRAPTLFPYARWHLEDEKDFVSTQMQLFQTISASQPAEADKARLRLLQIYLSEGLFPEAHGMANDILRVSYKFYRNNNVAAMRGAANFFMYRILDAERDFSSAELAGNPEAQMWLSLCRELLGESTAKPFNFLSAYDTIIRSYPPVFIQKLAIIAADLAINRKDYDSANSIFDIIRKDNFDEPVEKYITYMHAKILSETKKIEEAEKIWEKQAAEIDDPLIRARAEFSLVNLMLSEDLITPADAAKRLEKLRIVWRGDSLELNVLMLLGNLYLQQKEYAKALHTLRDIVLYYPDVPEAITTAQKMENVFVTLYNKKGADAMPPLEALSLFYEFRDLVPLGADGDLMIRNLADRLVNIDLLDRATLLLDHQVRKRLIGEERSRVGTRLALVYLFNHKPKEALETLKATGYGDLNPALQLTRQRLTAQALAQLGQNDKAIEVISKDTSAEGNALRLSIYWDNKDWPNVVAAAEEILGNRNDPSAPLENNEADVLLKLATAYVFEHDSGQIQYLRDYFTPLLKNGPGKDSFLFITSESGAIDYVNLDNLDKDMVEVKSYLDTYRDKVKKNGLSNVIN